VSQNRPRCDPVATLSLPLSLLNVVFVWLSVAAVGGSSGPGLGRPGGSTLLQIDARAVAGAARIVLLLVFALAAFEKLTTLLTRSAAWHPVLVMGRRRRRYASRLIAASLVADGFVLITLVASPTVGALVASTLVITYTAAGLGASHSQEGCRCFWRAFNSSTSAGMVARNACLILLAAGSRYLLPRSSAGALALAVLMCVCLWGITRIVDRVMQSHPARAPTF
jgi:hypothetical protein